RRCPSERSSPSPPLPRVLEVAPKGRASTSSGVVLTRIQWNHGATDVLPRKKPVLADTAGRFTKHDGTTRLRVTWQGSVVIKAPASPEFSWCTFFLKIDGKRGSIERVIRGSPRREGVYAPTLVDFFDGVPAGRHTI